MSTVSRPRRNIWHGVWRTLGSIQLAAVLLFALALASLLASLFPQMPAEPAAREPWLAAITLRYGRTTRLLRALSLFDAYRSPWYLTLLTALSLNILLCTLQRVLRLWQSLNHRPKVVMPGAFYVSAARRAEWAMPSTEQGLRTAQENLRRRGYRVHTEVEQEMAYLYAERGRWIQACSPISHVAALLLVLALAARPTLSWRHTGVLLLPGEIHSVGHGRDWSVRAGPLTIERHPAGEPHNYDGCCIRVPLTVLQDVSTSSGTLQAMDARTVRTVPVRINRPLIFQGVAFHLQSYGPAVQVTIPEETHSLPFVGSQTQEIRMQAPSREDARLTLRVTYQHQGATLFVEALDANGSLLGSGVVVDGKQIQVDDTPITFQLSQYTVWQVSHDPTFAPAIGAAALFLMAATVSLWVPHRRLWLRVDGQNAQMVSIGDWDFEALARKLADAPLSGGQGGVTGG